MPVTAVEKTIVLHDPVTITATSPQDWLDDFATWVAANANHWSVVDNDVVSTDGRQILMKTSDVDHPNLKVGLLASNALDKDESNVIGTTWDSATYNPGIFAHVDHAADTFDAAFDVGQILTGSGFIPAHCIVDSTFDGYNTFSVLEKSDGIIIVLWNTTDVPDPALLVAGGWGKNLSGDIIHLCAEAVNLSINAFVSSTIPSFPPGQINSSPSSQAVSFAWIEGTGLRGVQRVWEALDDGLLGSMRDRTLTKFFTTAIPMQDEDNFIAGFFHQLRIGRNDTLLSQRVNDDGQEWITIAFDSSTAGNALWIKQPTP